MSTAEQAAPTPGTVEISRRTVFLRRFLSGDLGYLRVILILFVIWALCVLVFHITVALVHLLVVLAVIAVVMHFVRKARTPV